MKVGQRTFNSSHQIYHRPQRWAMEVFAAVGTKLNGASFSVKTILFETNNIFFGKNY